MHKMKKVSGAAVSMPAGIGIGVGVSMAITVIGAMLLAWLVSAEKMRESAVGYGAMGILVLASFAGAMCAGGAIKRRRLMVCGICTAGYYLGLIMIALLFGGEFEGMGTTALFVLVGGGIAILLGLAGNMSGAGRRKIPHYR